MAAQILTIYRSGFHTRLRQSPPPTPLHVSKAHALAFKGMHRITTVGGVDHGERGSVDTAKEKAFHIRTLVISERYDKLRIHFYLST